MEEGFPRDVTPFDYTGMKAMHRHMFQDIYEWAGKERTYTTGRNPVPYAVPEHIFSSMNKLFADLKGHQFLAAMQQQEFVRNAAHYVNELNAIHQFLEGNGRVGRQWIRMIGTHAGFDVRFGSGDREKWYDAAEHGFNNNDPSKFAKLIEDRVH